MLQIPTVGLNDLVEERGAKRTVAGHAFVFADQIEDSLRAAEDICMDRSRIVETGNLRHVSRNKVAARGEFAGVRHDHTGRDLEKSRLTRAVAADESDVLAFSE